MWESSIPVSLRRFAGFSKRISLPSITVYPHLLNPDYRKFVRKMALVQNISLKRKWIRECNIMDRIELEREKYFEYGKIEEVKSRCISYHKCSRGEVCEWPGYSCSIRGTQRVNVQ